VLNWLLNNQGAWLRKSVLMKRFHKSKGKDTAVMLDKKVQLSESETKETYFAESQGGVEIEMTVIRQERGEEEEGKIESKEEVAQKVERETEGNITEEPEQKRDEGAPQTTQKVGRVSESREAAASSLDEIKAIGDIGADLDISGVKVRGAQRTPRTSEDGTRPIPRLLADNTNAGLAIWLGLLIDSFPESIVIGILTSSSEGISYTFLVGVLLSNFPEALSSSKLMMDQGMRRLSVLFLWVATMLVTGFGAGFGAIIFADNTNASSWQDDIAKGMEGIAAGAMLVMIADTALPEACRDAGNLVGLATLGGFLAAYIVEVLD